jgi:hydrogenase expression/formation protein HypE
MNEPRPGGETERILLSHGGGGQRTHELIATHFLPRFQNEALARMEDAARVRLGAEEIAFTTDSFVVSPLFFPGGDLGSLAVCGTVNDLSVMGATPIALSAAFVLEEGFPIEQLVRILDSMKRASEEAGVPIVTGDTKVVERGACDRIIVNTSGIGRLAAPLPEGRSALREGDRVLVSGPIGDHGMAVLAARGELAMEAAIESDCAPLSAVTRLFLERTPGVRWMRDPTRGGLGMCVNELVAGSELGLELDEERIPVRPSVRALCEILGLDPLYVACEGRFVAVIAEGSTETAFDVLRSHPYGRGAVEIGRITREEPGRVLLRTASGGLRVVPAPSGEQLPRIC